MGELGSSAIVNDFPWRFPPPDMNMGADIDAHLARIVSGTNTNRSIRALVHAMLIANVVESCPNAVGTFLVHGHWLLSYLEPPALVVAWLIGLASRTAPTESFLN